MSQNIKLGSKLGEGAYGKVYEAMNLKDGKFLAVKVMNIPDSLNDDKKS